MSISIKQRRESGRKFMQIDEKLLDWLYNFVSEVKERPFSTEGFAEACEMLKITRLYYDFDLGDSSPYRNRKLQNLVVPGSKDGKPVIIYDSGKKSGLSYKIPYSFRGSEYAHAYIDFDESVEEKDINKELCRLISDIIYLAGSRSNMQMMLNYAETTDPQTGIPNSIFIARKYEDITRTVPADNYMVLYINLQNFKYLNEVGTSKGGDEAIMQYSHKITGFVGEDECVCRMGGDNYVMFIRRENFDSVAAKLSVVTLDKLRSIPGRSFEISAWIGVSGSIPDDKRSFNARINEAAIACNIGKTRLKQKLVFYSEELKVLINRGREIMSMFYPAVKNHEFHPFFQAKVDMRTGKLVGFEALCRWIHDGRFIFPDQFIPVLDKEGLIHELDITIFRETCSAIKRWKDMGLNPPRISSNFSRKNLFIEDIEDKISSTIEENGISVGDVEIEITESVQESETARLISFVRSLKERGLHISIDDFGTGYSSLMLIHNIDADVIKIDKSFVDEIPGDKKSEVLIESIISIARNLNMSVIAEGVETAEQGRSLLNLGCDNAQGYYYSKPVDFEAATEIIRKGFFEPIA